MITNTNTKNEYTTTGTAGTVYSLTFDGTDSIVVELKRSGQLAYRTLTYPTEYQKVLTNRVVSGITLRLAADYAANNALRISRSTPLTQQIDFQVGRIDPETVEKEADLSVMRDQELNAKIDREFATPEDHETRITTLEGEVDDIEELLPTQATASNQLADKNFVNSSIVSATAHFMGTYNSLAELQAVTGAGENDYGNVIRTDSLGNTYYDRYKYSNSTWTFEYTVNNTSFTAVQWAALNSGVTTTVVSKVNSLPILITDLVVDATTGVITLTANNVVTTLAIKTLFGGTAISGTTTGTGTQNLTFTPTTASDILGQDWVVTLQ